MSVIVRAIYRAGIFEPSEPIADLMDNQEVELEVWPFSPLDEMRDTFWTASDRLALNPAEIERHVQAVHDTWACIALPPEQAVEIATADWLLEENLA